jgi:prepilin-type N-terminal cleavage/methylation domain-containing protein
MKRGYTLVEILICIAIVATLAGIVFVVSAPVRAKSRESVCISNLRQMYLGTAIYRQDYDGKDPVEGQVMTLAELGLPRFNSVEAVDSFYQVTKFDKNTRRCPEYMALYKNDPVYGNPASSYTPGFWDNTDVPAKPTFSEVISQQGMRAALWLCDYHNVKLPPVQRPRWYQHKIILVRFDGSCKTVMIDKDAPFSEAAK